MTPASDILLNTSQVEVWPAHLLRARNNQDARRLARSTHVLRRKRDGRYLAVIGHAGVAFLQPRFRSEPGIAAALHALDAFHARRRAGVDAISTLPVTGLQLRLAALGLDDGYGQRTGLALVPEPERLAFAGSDRYRRALWLLPGAARAWTHLRDEARREGVLLDAISGYRNHDYQLGIFERKRARGQHVDEILEVNAAPGYSEHHSGRALDIGTPDEPPAEESFERTPAFAWLRENAGGHGFVMSYPRDNPHGIVYEPWHWCWRGDR
ncbi:MAG: D-alanyl-D-alanine carboxypeptidase family protein [Luteimonas sp.]